MIVGEFVLWFPLKKRKYPEFLFYIIGLLVRLTEQARVVFVRLRYYSNVALKPVVRSLFGFFLSLLAKF